MFIDEGNARTRVNVMNTPLYVSSDGHNGRRTGAGVLGKTFLSPPFVHDIVE